MSINHRMALTVGVVGALSPLVMAETVTQQQILQRLERLEQTQRDYQEELQRNQEELRRNRQELQSKDQRIEELERQLQQHATVPPTATPVAPAPVSTAAVSQAAPAVPEALDNYGYFIPGRGFQVANTDHGSLSFSVYSYLRYLNQGGLDDSYTDSFGRTREIDQRNDAQLQKVMIYLKGWVYDPDLSYVFYTWTSNTSQGDGAQVVVGGYLNYRVSDAFSIGGGIFGLPSTRSMEGGWPNLLKVDNRTIADEYFRGSYTTGIFATGALLEGVQYRAMLGNNLSQLGVSGAQMDDTFDTFSGALWWMPTTGEYGPGQGFGDYEHHREMATRIGFHFTHSTEEKQSQPGKEDPENSQIRISDGTAIFDIDAFAPGTQIEAARYQMVAVDAGLKYRGFALEGEYYWRQVDQFRVVGALPFDRLDDHGFQLQASMMVLPKSLQLYLSGSKIYGEYGDPYDVALGTNWWPLRDNRKLRVNAELLYLYDSPVGYTSVPFTVGGNGTVFNTNLEFSF